jgi:hypothetical protein
MDRSRFRPRRQVVAIDRFRRGTDRIGRTGSSVRKRDERSIESGFRFRGIGTRSKGPCVILRTDGLAPVRLCRGADPDFRGGGLLRPGPARGSCGAPGARGADPRDGRRLSGASGEEAKRRRGQANQMSGPQEITKIRVMADLESSLGSSPKRSGCGSEAHSA